MAHQLAQSPSYDGPAPPRAEVFNRLVGEHQHAAYNFAYRVLGDQRAAAEVTQSAFLALYRQRPSFSTAAFRCSVFREIAAACSRRLRTRPRPPAGLRPVGLQAAGPVATHERDRDVQAGILTLPPQQRIVLVLADVFGLGYRDIAHIAGLPVVSVTALLGRARTALAAYLCA